jgi:putative DNA primase/helicase
MSQLEAAFMDAMRSASLAMRTERLVADGCLHRYRVDGDKSGTLNGWYVLNVGHPAYGAFGSWKTGQSETWHHAQQATLNDTDRRALADRQAAARSARDAAQTEVHTFAAARASKLWQTSRPATNKHPYLLRKGVAAFGLRQLGDKLVIPLRDESGALWSLQFIDADGSKRFLSGGRKRGCYFSIGAPSDTLCICEGYATAASVFMSTKFATAVAFDAGNLTPVATALRNKFPALKIIIAADNDVATVGNPGLAHALDAARAIDGLVAYPTFDKAD